jgi:hypothetical protein
MDNRWIKKVRNTYYTFVNMVNLFFHNYQLAFVLHQIKTDDLNNQSKLKQNVDI